MQADIKKVYTNCQKFSWEEIYLISAGSEFWQKWAPEHLAGMSHASKSWGQTGQG